VTSLSRRVQRAADTAARTAQDTADVIGRHPGRVTALLVGSSVTAWAVTYAVVTRGQAAARAGRAQDEASDGAGTDGAGTDGSSTDGPGADGSAAEG
jgi:predicted metal-binding membrane protein